MRHRAAVLAARRDLAVARSAFLRAELQCEAAVIGRRLRFIDRATAVARSVPSSALLAGGVLLLVLTGPRKLLRVAGRALASWQVAQSLASIAAGVMTAARSKRG
jgi:hypothetical protein